MRAAIFQNTLTGGGRMVVINEMVAALNKLNITPDLYTFRVSRSFQKHPDISFKVLKLKSPIKGFYNLKVSSLNLRMRQYASQYDLLINSNNTLIFAPHGKNNYAYVHFPREMRVRPYWKQLPGNITPKSIIDKLDIWIFRGLLQFGNLLPDIKIAANSGFTKEMLLRFYSDLGNSPVRVIYPPVLQYPEARERFEKEKMVVSIGRFGRDKNQLFQIHLAEHFPEISFVICGFIGDRQSLKYYEFCRDIINSKGLKNVQMLENITQDQKVALLKKAQIFLHSCPYEPFGISTAEALQFRCIPIVHNSGGQVEIVPIKNLRFTDLQGAILCLGSVENLSFTDFSILDGLNTNFSPDTFKKEFLDWIKESI